MDKQPLNKKFGDYRCIHMLDANNDTQLFHALHTKTGRMVLLRVMYLHLSPQKPETHEPIRQSCLDEMKSVQQLTSPYIVPVQDFGIDNDKNLYFSMPMLLGDSLYKRLKITRKQALPLPSLGQISDFLQRIASALQEMHAKGMVHGQVEPRAILFDETGKSYLGDAGMIRLQKILFHLDNTNSFSVTRYSAPELWEGERPLPESDQYALACITYELITGRPPFESETVIGLMNSHLNQAAAPINTIRPELEVAIELSAVLWQALAKPPENRFKDVTAFAETFARVVAGHRGTPTDFFTFTIPKKTD